MSVTMSTTPERQAQINEYARGFHPRGPFLLVQRDRTDGRSPGGIIIPDVARNYQKQGVVLAVGPGYELPDGTRAQRQTFVGDHVFFNIYGTKAVPGWDELYIMAEDVVEFVLEE